MRDRHCKTSKKTPGPVIAALALAALLLLPHAVRAEGVITPQAFSRGSFVFVVDQQRIVFLSMDTRSSHTLYDAGGEDGAPGIIGAVRSGDMIWASGANGAVLAVNMQTGTVEDFSRSLVSGGGHIDVDRRFVWLASGDTLYRMDLTTLEWVALPVPNAGGEVRGLLSFNDQIHIISERAVHILTTASEDWVVIPHKNFVLARGGFHRLGDAAYITQEKSLYRYDPAKRLWGSGTVRDRIRAVHLSPELLAVAAENRIYHFNTANLVLEPQPALPMLRGIRSVVRFNGATICVTGRGLAFNAAHPFDFNIAIYPSGITVGENVFAFEHGGHIVLYTDGRFILHHHDRRLWSGVRIMNRAGSAERKGAQGWTEEGARMDITDNIHSNLHGVVTLRQHPTFTQNEDEGLITYLGDPLANTTLNVHTVDLDGRIFDLTVDNAVTTQPPQKGFYYKGAEGDILNRASFGVQGTGLAASGINTAVVAEGGSAVFSSAATAPNRDRQYFSATAGGGHILSKTEWRGMEYRHSNIYQIDELGANREVVASSVKMYVDGIPLPETDYTYNPANRTVHLLRRDKVNPTSVIHLSFSERVFPGDRAIFEPFPEDHFGRYGFAEGAVSPRSWLSARGGVMMLDNGTVGPYTANPDAPGPMLMAGLPIELRSGANHALLLHPEVAYDATMGTHSGGFTAGAREGRAFASYRGMWTERDFRSIDQHRHEFVYQRTSDEHEMNVGYDIHSNFRAGWYQFHRRTQSADLSHFELRSSFTGDGYILPDVEMSVSSRITDYAPVGGNRDRKETFMLRLSDQSARFLSEANRIHNVGYDISWTEYQTNYNQSGRVIYGLSNISPISPLTFTGAFMYRLNPKGFHVNEEVNPSLSVNVRELPRGFDLNAGYAFYISELTEGGSDVAKGNSISLFFRPGEYVKALDRFILYAGYVNETAAHANPTESSLKYAFLTDTNTYAWRVMEEAGLIYFPMDNLLLSTFNTRERNQNSETFYRALQRMRWWFNYGSAFEGNIYINKKPWQLYTHADATYEHRWESGLLTGIGVFGTRDSEHHVVNIHTGPQFILSQTIDLNRDFLRSIEHSHRLRIVANIEDMASPDLAIYTMYLRLKMRPNISLVAEMGISAENMEDIGGSGGIYLHAGF